MRYLDVKAGTIPSEEITFNRGELAARLQVPRTSSVMESEVVWETAEEIRTESRCRYAYVRLPVQKESETVILLGGIRIESRSLSKSLADCDEAFLFGVTLGAEIDRFLRRAAVTGSDDSFFYDAAASALAESLCDAAAARMKATCPDCRCHARFSPGYGDLALSLQPAVLDRLNAVETLGIAIDPETFWMTPIKSITAVMGIENNPSAV